jgi:hypothetical protein
MIAFETIRLKQLNAKTPMRKDAKEEMVASEFLVLAFLASWRLRVTFLLFMSDSEAPADIAKSFCLTLVPVCGSGIVSPNRFGLNCDSKERSI